MYIEARVDKVRLYDQPYDILYNYVITIINYIYYISKFNTSPSIYNLSLFYKLNFFDIISL